VFQSAIHLSASSALTYTAAAAAAASPSTVVPAAASRCCSVLQRVAVFGSVLPAAEAGGDVRARARAGARDHSMRLPRLFSVVRQSIVPLCYLLQCVAVICSDLQWFSVCCSVLQCVAMCCSVLQCAIGSRLCDSLSTHFTLHCNTLQHTVQHTATHSARQCNTLRHARTRVGGRDCKIRWPRSFALQRTASHCNTPQHSATHCNTLQDAFASPAGTFSKAVSTWKLKTQSSSFSFATFQWKETFKLWALSFERAFENVTTGRIGCTFFFSRASVANTQLNHWTKRVVNTWIIT